MTTFLIVDDHLPFRQQARALLEAEGLAVVGEAGNGTAALEAVRRIRPDVVVVDIGLPDMDGFELAERLAGEIPRPGIVLVSSREPATYGPRVAASPALGFLQKDDLSAASLLALVGERPEAGSPQPDAGSLGGSSPRAQRPFLGCSKTLILVGHAEGASQVATLFDRIGGFGTLSKVVLSFYDRVLDDDVLAPYFADVDMRRLIDHQTKFVAFLMGGPASYTDEHLRLAHARLGIDGRAFERMTEVMRDTLEDFRIADRDVDHVISQIHARRELIVAAPTPA